MTTLNLVKIKEEILNLIRNSDIFSITMRNVITETDNIVGIAGNTITLTQEGAKNIRSLTIDSVPQVLYVDYDINIMNKDATESKTINLTSALTGGESIVVVYDYSKISVSTGNPLGDRIYPDFPEDYLTVSSYPRIGFEIDSIANTNRSTNDTLQQKNVLINFIVIGLNNSLDNFEIQTYNLIFNNRKSLQNNNLMRPSGRSSKKAYKKFKTTVIYDKMFSFTLPTEFER